MQKDRLLASTLLIMQVAFLGTARHAQAREDKAPYAAMAPLSQYLIPDKNSEIALARTAAPPSISDAAEVLVLGPAGYTTAVKGTNGFVCLVERAFAASTDFNEFWNPKNRSPICVNAPAARTYLPTILMRARLAIAGKSKTEIAEAVKSARASNQLPAIEPDAMSYMMSRQQYLNDSALNWHPHMMWFVPGDVEKTWGANLPNSPLMAASDPEEGITIFMLVVGKWSDGTPYQHEMPHDKQ